MAGESALTIVPSSNDAVAFVESLTACAIATRHELSLAEIETYRRALSDLPLSRVRAALEEAAKVSEFFPSVATIRTISDQTRSTAPGVEATKAIVASYGRPEAVRAGEGEWKTHTVPGLGSITHRVLPDDHPALPRYHCLRCRDSGWMETTRKDFGRTADAAERCFCAEHNPVVAARRQRSASRRQDAQ